MKLLHRPERCLVLVERGEVAAVRWRDRAWPVTATRDVWTYRGRWWTDPPGLHGETRVYHVLATRRGDIEVFERRHAGRPGPDDAGDPGSSDGWWVSRWWD